MNTRIKYNPNGFECNAYNKIKHPRLMWRLLPPQVQQAAGGPVVVYHLYSAGVAHVDPTVLVSFSQAAGQQLRLFISSRKYLLRGRASSSWSCWSRLPTWRSC